MPSTIDILWSKEATELTPEDVDQIIIHIRKQMAMYDAGVKPKPEANEQIDWSSLVSKLSGKEPEEKPKVKPPATPTKRRL